MATNFWRLLRRAAVWRRRDAPHALAFRMRVPHRVVSAHSFCEAHAYRKGGENAPFCWYRFCHFLLARSPP